MSADLVNRETMQFSKSGDRYSSVYFHGIKHAVFTHGVLIDHDTNYMGCRLVKTPCVKTACLVKREPDLVNRPDTDTLNWIFMALNMQFLHMMF